MTTRQRWLWLLAPLLLLAIWGQQRRTSKPTTGLRVVKVVDGDTVVLSDGRTVRYIGIDTPEHGQPYFDAARNFNRKLVLNKPVELEFDVERYDHYGRLLAYVFVRDEKGRRVFVNAEMVRNGFARTYTKPPNVRYADLFVRLQEEARKNRRGLWSVYHPTRQPVIGNRNTLSFSPSPSSSGQLMPLTKTVQFIAPSLAFFPFFAEKMLPSPSLGWDFTVCLSEGDGGVER